MVLYLKDLFSFFRLPAECSTCSEVHEIDDVHVDDITFQDFAEK